MYGPSGRPWWKVWRSAAANGVSMPPGWMTLTYDDDTLTADLQLTLLKDKLAALDRRARELDATRTALATKIADLEARARC